MQVWANVFADVRARWSPQIATHPVLFLLGNIGRLDSPKTIKFIKYCRTNWDKVVLVPSAYDFSGSEPYWKMTDRVRDMGIVHGEHCETRISGIPVLTCSLWSAEPFIAGSKENPYSDIIIRDDVKASPLDIAEWAWDDRDWLKGRLSYLKNIGQKAVVLTVESPRGRIDGIMNDPIIARWMWGGGAEAAAEALNDRPPQLK